MYLPNNPLNKQKFCFVTSPQIQIRKLGLQNIMVFSSLEAANPNLPSGKSTLQILTSPLLCPQHNVMQVLATEEKEQ